MPMTPGQTATLESWLQSRGRFQCACGSWDFTYNDDLVAAPAVTSEGDKVVPVQGEAYVMVVLRCTKCALVRLYSAREVGLIS